VRHRNKLKKLGRTASHRRAVLANLATAIIDKERIRTTDALAGESKKVVEKLITKAKVGTLHARRQVLRVIKDKKIVAKLFDTIAPRYVDRHGGYVRLIHVGNRHGDGASLSIVELIGSELSAEEPKKTKKKSKKETEEKQTVPSPVDEEKKEEKAEAKDKAKVEAEAEEKVEDEEKKKDDDTPTEDSPKADPDLTTPEKEGGKTGERG